MSKEMTDKEKDLNQYFTPPGPVALLYEYLDYDVNEFNRKSRVLEPCAGDGGVANVFGAYGHPIQTNDIDPSLEADLTTDFLKAPVEKYIQPDWVITNPPFTIRIDGELKKASDFVKKAMKVARKGVAFLVRSSFLEPCNDRKNLLKHRPPNNIIILPRISFTRDGKTDSANYHWLIWRKYATDLWRTEVDDVVWRTRKDVKRAAEKFKLRPVE